MDTQTLKLLVQNELELRGREGHEELQQWVESIRELRAEVPDWCRVVLELIEENEGLRRELAKRRAS